MPESQQQTQFHPFWKVLTQGCLSDTPSQFRDFMDRLERTKLEHRALVEIQRRKSIKEGDKNKMRELVIHGGGGGDDPQISRALNL